MKTAFWMTLLSVGALTACGDKDTATGDSGGNAVRADNPVSEAPPAGDATVEIANLSGYTFYFILQCDYSEGTCYDALGSDVLLDGESLIMELEPGAWFTVIIDEDSYCSDLFYEVEAGESYIWDVYESDLYGIWDDASGYCY